MGVTEINRDIVDLLGAEAEALLGYRARGIPKERLHLPGPDFVSESFGPSDRSPRVLRSLQTLYGHGRLAGTGYLSILPVDQGIEHSGGASFARNPDYFDPERIVELAIEGGCNAVASTFGVLGMVARKYAHKIPFIVKLNHNELMSYPNEYAQIMFGTIEQAYDMGAVAVGATVYFGSPDSEREIVEVAEAFAHAHELGMATVLWCYTRNDAFKVDGTDYPAAKADRLPLVVARRTEVEHQIALMDADLAWLDDDAVRVPARRADAVRARWRTTLDKLAAEVHDPDERTVLAAARRRLDP